MPRELILKFRDDILLTPDLSLLSRFKLPPDYFEYAARHMRNTGRTPIYLNGLSVFVPHPARQLWGGFDKLLRSILDHPDQAENQAGATPTFLFEEADPGAAYRLLERARKPIPDRYKRIKGAAGDVTDEAANPPLLPNLYNYVKISLPDTDKGDALLVLLKKLALFLPRYDAGQKRIVGGGLLAYVYLKEDPTPLSTATPAQSALAGANQRYYQAMKIKTPTHASQGKQVGLTVVEVNSWFVGHGQFGPAVPPVIFPLIPLTSAGFTLTNPGPNATLAHHGTAVMGLLRAKSGDTDQAGKDLCRGLVPRATIRLASCLTTLTLSPADPNHILDKRYDEAAAVLQAILDSEAGDVILLEFGLYQQTYPAEVAPAIFELLNLAFHLGIIVVEAAGNQSLYIGPSSSAAAQALSSLAIIDLSENQQLNSGLSWTCYEALKARIEAEYATLGTQAVGFETPEAFAQNYFLSSTNAILVGAAQDEVITPATTAVQKEPTSTWGPRVRVYAQGQNMLTTTYGGAASPNHFTAIGHTSGAAAIIAGLVTSLQGIAKGKNYLITPTQMARLLETGLPVRHQGQPTGGVIPDYSRAVATLRQWIADDNGTS